MNYKRAPQKFVCLGLDLNRPPDLLAPGKYPFLKNVHSYQEGRLETRGPVAPLNSIATTPDIEIVSSFFMNDYVTNSFKRFLKVGASLYYGDTSFIFLEAGFSTLPFAPVAYRPDQSARVWGYLADAAKMRKVNTDGTNYLMGVIPPSTIPTAALGIPLYVAPGSFDAATSWTAHDSAGSVSLVARLTSVVIDKILYDTGSTGWACVSATGGNFQDITAGMRLIFASTETATVEDLHRPYTAAANTIAQIIYDSGTSGLCTVQPTLAMTGVNRNTMLLLGSDLVRVISITMANDGTFSFRCSVATHAAGDAITAPANGSFRVYLTGTRAAGNTLLANALQSTITTGSATTAGEGLIAFNYGAGSGINLGFVTGRPLGPDDYLHLSVKIDVPGQLVEGHLVLDVSPTTTGSWNAADGQQNAYYIPFRANDLQSVLTGGQTSTAALNTAIQLQQQAAVDASFSTNQGGGALIPSPDQLNLGSSQWTEFRWKISDLVRVGAAQGVDISAVNAVQVIFNVLGNCVIQVGNLWVGGGYGPDTGNNFEPFQYRYRYRSSATGAHSLPGPAMREGLTSLRQQVNLTGVASSDAQIDKIDWERFGGQALPGASPEWHYIGTGLNSSPTFIDTQTTQAILVNPPLDVTAYQPFPVSDKPRTFVATVAGSAILRTGGTDTVNTAWAIGTALIINGQVTSIYAPPVGSIIQVADSMPSGTGLTVEISEPILAGQPLPYMWGPFQESLFACGNILDAGSVYWTNPTDPDSAPDTNRVECCSPSEALVHGCAYDGRNYVFSDKRLFAIVPSFQANSQYNVIPVPNSRGLWSPYALTVGPKIWFLAADGIYETDGGTLLKISTDIDPIFPNGDRQAYAVNGLYPVAMTAAGSASQLSYLRLTYHNGELFFDYRDCHGDAQTLCYGLKDKAWYYYVYFEGTEGPTKVNFHVSETGFEDNDALANLVVGTNQGLLFTSNGNGSGVETINCVIRTPALDVGDSRAKKIYGDIVYDMATDGLNVVTTPYINNYQSALPSKTYNQVTRSITSPADLSLGVGQFARNLGIEITWSLST